MLISRKLANKAQNRLQVIFSLVEDHDTKKALNAINELSALLNRHVETVTEEHDRKAREEKD